METVEPTYQTPGWRSRLTLNAKRAASRVIKQWDRRNILKVVGKEMIAEVKPNLNGMQSFRAENFPQSGPVPWLDRPDALNLIEEKLRQGKLSKEDAELCRHWHINGFVVLPQVFSPETLDRIWGAYDQSLASGRVTFEDYEERLPGDNLPTRSLNPHQKVQEINEVLRSPEILNKINLLLGQKPVPFQTLAFYKGSAQAAHSDFIHMTTFPVGYLAATWTAFEDIHPDSGPLFYYPGSHRLSYHLSREAGIEPGEYASKGRSVYYDKYEPMVQRLVEKHALSKQLFHPKKGDVFIWHANLLHGGSERRNLSLSRKSIVCHYFARGVLCYHDLAGQLADYNRAYRS